MSAGTATHPVELPSQIDSAAPRQVLYGAGPRYVPTSGGSGGNAGCIGAGPDRRPVGMGCMRCWCRSGTPAAWRARA